MRRSTLLAATIAALALLLPAGGAAAAPASGASLTSSFGGGATAAKGKASAQRRRAAAKRRAKLRQVPAGIVDLPVSFTVVNRNTSAVPCPADGRTYVVRGHLTGPKAALDDPARRAAALYVHGLGYGEFFWRFRDVPGYDHAVEMARAGFVSVTIDRLGYGASGRPDGNEVCYGSEGDYLDQITDQLRAGTYGVEGGQPVAMRKIALVGHSAGGFMVEAAQISFGSADAMVLMGFANEGAGLPAYTTLLQTQVQCFMNPLEGDYANFGGTDQVFADQHFGNVEPAVAARVLQLNAPDPCGDTFSAPVSVLVDAIRINDIRSPVFIVGGKLDKLFPPPAAKTERNLWLGKPARVEAVEVDGTPHAMTLGRTAPKVRALIADFLRGQGF